MTITTVEAHTVGCSGFTGTTFSTDMCHGRWLSIMLSILFAALMLSWN